MGTQDPRDALGEDRPARRLKLRHCSKVEAQLGLRRFSFLGAPSGSGDWIASELLQLREQSTSPSFDRLQLFSNRQNFAMVADPLPLV